MTDPSRDAGVIAAFGNRIEEKETEVGFGMIRYFQGSLAEKRIPEEAGDGRKKGRCLPREQPAKTSPPVPFLRCLQKPRRHFIRGAFDREERRTGAGTAFIG